MRKANFYIFIFFICSNAFGQILDDSTKAIYGPKTVKYFTEIDVFNNQSIKYDIDTSLINFHQQFLIKRINHFEIQDLGNNGTSSKPIFINASTNLGVQFGLDAFQHSILDFKKIKYYNTKSPYSEMIYFQGGKGQDFAKFIHSQNITKQWNVAVELENFASTKILGFPNGRDDRLLKNWNASMQSNYTSKNNKYILLGGFNFFSHYQVEQGGILPSGEADFDQTFAFTNEVVKMTRASNTQKSQYIHTYQQFSLAKGLQVFHILDLNLISNMFIDNAVFASQSNGFYKNIKPNSESKKDSVGYFNFDNKIGLKGRFKGYNYRIHARIRNLTGFGADSSILTKTELYTGFWTAYYFKDSSNKLIAEGEIGANTDFYLKGELITKFGKAQFINSYFSPNFVQNFSSILFENEKKFLPLKQTNMTELKIFPFISINKNVVLKPFLSLSNINNHIYFDSTTKVKQFEKNIRLIRVGLQSVVYKKKWIFETNFSFNQSSNTDIIRIPTLFFDANISKSYTFAKKLLLESGIHLNFQTKFFADAYNPQSGQFYIQNYMKVQGYPSVDFFTNMKVNRVRLTLHLNNFTNIQNTIQSSITKAINKGFFTTPSYTALPMSFGFGVNWPLYD